MISRIDHISLAVKDFDKARNFFETVFGAVVGVGAKEDALKYFWNIFSIGDLTRLEIMEPTGDGSFLDNFLQNKKDGGVHHITLETPDIKQFKNHLDQNQIPYFGYAELGDFWKELFIHPKDAFGVLIQVAEMSDPDDYLPESLRHGKGKPWSVEKTDAGVALSLSHPGGGKMRMVFSRDDLAALVDDLKDIMSDD